MTVKTRSILLALPLAAALAATAIAPVYAHSGENHDQGSKMAQMQQGNPGTPGMMQGQGMGKGMMQGQGQGMGKGMMQGQGMGKGMMQGQGQGMGMGMMQGQGQGMGMPGMMQGRMGMMKMMQRHMRGMMGKHGKGFVRAKPLSGEDVKRVIDGRLSMRGLSRLMAANVKIEDESAALADIVTAGGEKVFRVRVDRKSGRISIIE